MEPKPKKFTMKFSLKWLMMLSQFEVFEEQKEVIHSRNYGRFGITIGFNDSQSHIFFLLNYSSTGSISGF